MTDDQRPFKHVHLSGPLPGLEEESKALLDEYLLHIAEMILGLAGTLISASKVSFVKRNPDHFPVFNANVCIEPARKIWFGDLDLTEDEEKLAVLARALGAKVYVLSERDGRFSGRDEQPLLERAVLTVAPDGTAEHVRHLCRAADGRLRPAR